VWKKGKRGAKSSDFISKNATRVPWLQEEGGEPKKKII